MALSNRRQDRAIGAIEESILTEAQFQALNGTTWVLMDGRDVSGSALATYTGTVTLPDARGVVLRGKNNGRADGNQDPAGERAIGAFQNQATAKNGLTVSDTGHGHPIGYTGNLGYSGGGGNANTFWGAGSNQNTNSSVANISTTSSDAETRMRNIAVNIFIKIN